MLTWNIPNWITVLLMVSLGYLVVSIGAQLVRSRLGGGGSANDNAAATPLSFAGVFGKAA